MTDADEKWIRQELRRVLACGGLQYGAHIDTLPAQAALPPIAYPPMVIDPPGHIKVANYWMDKLRRAGRA
jgi:hypothetical protein